MHFLLPQQETRSNIRKIARAKERRGDFTA